MDIHEQQALQHRFDADYRKGRPEILHPKVRLPGEPVSLWRFKRFEYIVRMYHWMPGNFESESTLRNALFAEIGEYANGTSDEVKSALLNRWNELQNAPQKPLDWLAIRLEGVLHETPLNAESIELLLCAFLMDNDTVIHFGSEVFFEGMFPIFSQRIKFFCLCTGLSREVVVEWCTDSCLLRSNDFFDSELRLEDYYQKALMGLTLLDHEVWG